MKVSAYCRVSTDHEDQANSLESQKKYFYDYINRNPEWELVKIYVDDGLTGTSTKKRKAFKEMLEDAENGEFELLLTKEVSRFARNTLDSISYTRLLKSQGIGVIFLNDNINTLDPDSELRLTIMSSIAQEESRKTSSRVQWGIKRCMERGFAWGSHPYGFNLKNGILTINESEAQTVRLIFELYISGLGRQKIKHELERRGIVSPTGLYSWKESNILRMLKNERYCGDLVQRKKVVNDFLTHEQVLNDKENYIVIENHHEAIVSKDLFNRVQQELARRSRKAVVDKVKYSNQYAFSGKIKCGLCDSSFHRRYHNGKHDAKNIVWQCKENIYHGKKKISPYDDALTVGCDSKGIHEVVLQEVFLQAAHGVFNNKSSIVVTLQNVVQEVIASSELNSSELSELNANIRKIEAKKLRILELFSEGDITKSEYRESRSLYDKQVITLNKRKQELEEEQEQAQEKQSRLKDVLNLIDRLASFDVFSDEVCREILDKAVVYSRERIDFFLSIDDAHCIPVLVQQDPLLPNPLAAASPSVRHMEPPLTLSRGFGFADSHPGATSKSKCFCPAFYAPLANGNFFRYDIHITLLREKEGAA